MKINKLLAFVATALIGVAAYGQAADGEVTKIDKPAVRVTIKHNGLKNLDMPAMSMAFKVTDPRLLDTLAVGDKVRFSADKVAGVYTVTTLTKAP
jgi:Cu/Ag efflux protein CusF